MTGRRARRREEVQRIRAEGETAAASGKPPETCPYPPESMNRHQWLRGYHWELDARGRDQCDT